MDVAVEFRLVKVRAEDLERLEKLSSETDFDMGLENRKICFSLAPDNAYFITTASGSGSGELIGFLISHLLTPTLVLRHQSYIRKEFRTGSTLKKLSDMYQQLLLPNYKGNFFHCCNHKSLRAFVKQHPCIVGPKILSHGGLFDPKKLELLPDYLHMQEKTVDIGLVETADDLKHVQKYDRSINPVPRDWFLEKWCFDPDKSVVVTAIASTPTYGSNNRTNVGYATVRFMKPGWYWITMAYADSPLIAGGLLKEILRHVPRGNSLWFSFPAKQSVMLDIVKRLDLEWIYAEHRIYDIEEIEIDWDRVFINHEYFLL